MSGVRQSKITKWTVLAGLGEKGLSYIRARGGLLETLIDFLLKTPSKLSVVIIMLITSNIYRKSVPTVHPPPYTTCISLLTNSPSIYRRPPLSLQAQKNLWHPGYDKSRFPKQSLCFTNLNLLRNSVKENQHTVLGHV